MYEYNKLKFCPKCGGKLVKKLTDERKRLTCLKCGYILYRNSAPAVALIMEKDNKIVLIKRGVSPKAGFWALPSGFIEYEESPEEAAIREAKEEAGLKVKIKDLIGVYFFKEAPINVIGPTYYAKVISGKLKHGSDVRNVRFFNVDKLPKKFAFKEHLQSIKDWRKKYGK